MRDFDSHAERRIGSRPITAVWTRVLIIKIHIVKVKGLNDLQIIILILYILERRSEWVKESNKHCKTCIKCGEDFIWFPEDTWWDYQGSTPTKLAKCPCGCIQAVGYEKEINTNFDHRYYDLKK